jgi:hypothetical protein
MDDKAFKKVLAEVGQLDRREGIDLNDLLDISENLRQVLIWMIRNIGFQASDLGQYLGGNDTQAEQLLAALSDKGMIEEVKSTQRFYPQMAQARSGRKYRVSRDVWKALE